MTQFLPLFCDAAATCLKSLPPFVVLDEGTTLNQTTITTTTTFRTFNETSFPLIPFRSFPIDHPLSLPPPSTCVSPHGSKMEGMTKRSDAA